jgi:MFS family permease
LLLAMTSFLSIAGAACLVFSTGMAGGVAMAIYAFFCGICASFLFASVPLLAGTQMSSTRTIGAIAQAGGIATLLGPPIAGSIIEDFGWPALAGSFVVVALIGMAAILTTICASRPRVACLARRNGAPSTLRSRHPRNSGAYACGRPSLDEDGV